MLQSAQALSLLQRTRQQTWQITLVKKNVKWPCASVFAIAGVAGAFGGSSLGKMIDGQKLLILFALLMLVVGALMLLKRSGAGNISVRLNRGNFPALVALGFAAGGLSGFFGIGGGFLIVPALMLATNMAILNAVGSSLVAVTAFGVTTAANYAYSGYVDWILAAVFVAGGVLGGLWGARTAKKLSSKRGALKIMFCRSYLRSCNLYSSSNPNLDRLTKKSSLLIRSWLGTRAAVSPLWVSRCVFKLAILLYSRTCFIS